MKTILKITNTIFTVIALVLLPFIVFTLFTSKTGFIAGFRSFIVLSGSMQPSISVGSIIYTQPQNSYGASDVIAFTNKSDQTVTHRIVEVVNQPDGIAYKTRGDANNAADSELVPQKSVIGRQIFTVPFIGTFAAGLKTLPGFIGFIVLPALVFIGFEVMNIKKEMEKEIEKKLMNKIYQS